MKITEKKKEKITVELDASKLTPPQIRLIRSLNSTLYNVLTTADEGDFFDGSAEFMRLCASLIQQAQFTNQFQTNNIPYADQALEYSVDILQEHMASSKVTVYDN